MFLFFEPVFEPVLMPTVLGHFFALIIMEINNYINNNNKYINIINNNYGSPAEEKFAWFFGIPFFRKVKPVAISLNLFRLKFQVYI